MKTPLILALAIGACVMSASPAQAAEITLNQHYSGVTHANAMEDTNGDGIYARASSLYAVGSPGRATVEQVAEFTGYAYVGTPGCELRSDMVFDSFVSVFSDGSMLFSWATDGFICVDLATGEVWGELDGDITGSAGRFADATGDFEIAFNGYAATSAQNAFEGTAKGTIVLPD